MKPGDTLVVWKLDRLGRSLPHLLAIVADLRTRDVAFRSLTEAMDTRTLHGELLFSFFGALAQYERALNRERFVARLAAARRRGRRGGRPPSLTGEQLEQITAALRRRATRELNKGEAENALKHAIFFHRAGRLRNHGLPAQTQKPAP